MNRSKKLTFIREKICDINNCQIVRVCELMQEGVTAKVRETYANDKHVYARCDYHSFITEFIGMVDDDKIDVIVDLIKKSFTEENFVDKNDFLLKFLNGLLKMVDMQKIEAIEQFTMKRNLLFDEKVEEYIESQLKYMQILGFTKLTQQHVLQNKHKQVALLKKILQESGYQLNGYHTTNIVNNKKVALTCYKIKKNDK